MRHFASMVLGVGCWLGIAATGHGQVLDYPPAGGQMRIIPPVFPADGAVGAGTVETFPAFGGIYEVIPSEVQPVASAEESTRAVRRIGARTRPVRATRRYARAGSQPPAPYGTPLPMGQLPARGGFPAIDYGPGSRFDTFGQGYDVSPYGSRFFGGYFRGFPMAW
ncbi:hypothetical protein [Aquisphaera insulae]|uniref:hypothetical protein n=1 Tax=Aquisphaera insulae TaxID=2712864 RepID=UPI0013EB0113|nr:hypothetical protein [Aquisphaera insulae]